MPSFCKGTNLVLKSPRGLMLSRPWSWNPRPHFQRGNLEDFECTKFRINVGTSIRPNRVSKFRSPIAINRRPNNIEASLALRRPLRSPHKKDVTLAATTEPLDLLPLLPRSHVSTP